MGEGDAEELVDGSVAARELGAAASNRALCYRDCRTVRRGLLRGREGAERKANDADVFIESHDIGICPCPRGLNN